MSVLGICAKVPSDNNSSVHTLAAGT